MTDQFPDHRRKLWFHILEDLGPPIGCPLPLWLAAVFCLLFPLDGLRSILALESAMDLRRGTRTIHGVLFTDSFFLAIAVDDGRWYRFTHGPGGIVTVEARREGCLTPPKP